MGTLTKADLSKKLMSKLGIEKPDAKALVESFFGEISRALVENQHVKLSGFGNFILRNKSERPGRNPKTGEEVPVSARRVVTFRAGQKLTQRIEKVKIEK